MPLNDITAYIVPNDVFYSSPKWRDWYKNSPMGRMAGITDAHIEMMRSRDHSQSSAVCENCIYMFK